MSALLAAKTVLKADATLVGLALGGIYDFDDTGRLGINRANSATATAFGNGIIRPCILLVRGDSTPAGGLADEQAQVVSLRERLTVLFYQDGGYAAIEAMRLRVRTLLNFRQLTGTHRCLWVGDGPESKDLDVDANVRRSDYAVWSVG